MHNLPAAPECRSPKAIVHEWRRDAARMEVALALVLVFSICALLVAMTRDSSLASIVNVAFA
jgi:hypothetical protein